MKKFMRAVCFVLVCSLVLAVPARAEGAAEPRGSIFFCSYGTALEKSTSSSFKIWFDVDANAAMMDELGVSEIIIYRSPDMEHWTEMRVLYKEYFPVMTTTDAYFYTNYVTYAGATPGYYYTAYVTFYARDYRGIGERYVYTEIILM